MVENNFDSQEKAKVLFRKNEIQAVEGNFDAYPQADFGVIHWNSTRKEYTRIIIAGCKLNHNDPSKNMVWKLRGKHSKSIQNQTDLIISALVEMWEGSVFYSAEEINLIDENAESKSIRFVLVNHNWCLL